MDEPVTCSRNTDTYPAWVGWAWRTAIAGHCRYHEPMRLGNATIPGYPGTCQRYASVATKCYFRGVCNRA